MAESARNAYATTSGNAAAGAPNVIAVVNDGTADRQIVAIGASDGTTSVAEVNSSGQLATHDDTVASNLMNGSQLTQITGTSGIGVTTNNNRLDVNVTSSLGQNSMSGSVPIAIASDQTAVPIQGYQPAATAFTSVTTTGVLTSTSVANYNIATVTLRTFTGTTPSVTFRLEASDDNTNWVVLQGINNTTGQVGTSWIQASALAAGTAGPSIDYTIGAYANVRIHVTAISGTTATAAFGLALQTMPYEASPGALVQMPSLPSSGGALTAAAASSTSLVNTTSVIVAAVSNAASVTVTVKGTYTAVLIFEATDDGGTTWYAIVGARTDGSSSEITTATISSTIRGWKFDVSAFQYFRVRCTSFTSGSVTTNVYPTSMPTSSVAVLGQNNQIASAGTVSLIQNALPSGTNTLGSVIATGRATGGSTTYLLISAASTNSTLISTGSHTLYAINAYNNGATAAYVKIYNKSTAPAIGTDTPIKVVMLPAGGGSNIVLPPQGDVVVSGLGIGITGGAANSDTTAVALSQVIFNCSYV